jgi:hypothetical protein
MLADVSAPTAAVGSDATAAVTRLGGATVDSAWTTPVAVGSW